MVKIYLSKPPDQEVAKLMLLPMSCLFSQCLLLLRQGVWSLRSGAKMYFLVFAWQIFIIEDIFTHCLKADSCRTRCQYWAPVSFFNNLDLASVLNWGFAKIYCVLECAKHCIRDFMCFSPFPVVHIQGNLNERIVRLYMVVFFGLFFCLKVIPSLILLLVK